MNITTDRMRNGIYAMRVCKTCGQPFSAYDFRRRYCDDCRAVTAVITEVTEPVTESSWPASPPFSWDYPFRWNVCEECGCGFRLQMFDKETGEPLLRREPGQDVRFTHRRDDVRYCSNACRQKAYRQRKAGAA